MLLYQMLAFTRHEKIFLKKHAKIISLKYQLRHEMRNLNYLIDHILYQIILHIFLKNMRTLMIILQ